jgi:hypothetical protein
VGGIEARPASNGGVVGAAVASVRSAARDAVAWRGAAKGYVLEDLKEAFAWHIPKSQAKAMLEELRVPFLQCCFKATCVTRNQYRSGA